MNDKIKFAFFGSSSLSVFVLDELARLGLSPSLIVTTPDKPQGRKLVLTPNIVKEWAKKNNIQCFDPAKLDSSFSEELKRVSSRENIEISVVASYGKIIPISVINIPKYGMFNIHPSLLPKYRGASPLQSAILDDCKETGITIMKVDEQMDHGPIVAQEKVTINEWPIYEEYEEMMAKRGAQLLAKVIPDWIQGKIEAKEQDHSQATLTRKFTKEDGLIDLNGDPYTNYRKIQAFHEWPQAYFTMSHNGSLIRVKITQASFKENVLNIEKVIPEGSKEMNYSDFLRGYKN